MRIEAISPMNVTTDFSSPNLQFWLDVNRSPFFRLDGNNYINVAGNKQLNSMLNTSLLDIFLSAGRVIEPHYHQNAAELIYCISGAATVSILNPFTRQLHDFPLTPGQVVNVPRGWWHYEVATADGTHLLAIFDAPNPEVILFSDLLTLTPSGIIAHTYGIDEAGWLKAIAPVQPGTILGPRSGQQPDPTGGGSPSYSGHHQPWAHGHQAHPGFPVSGWPGVYGTY